MSFQQKDCPTEPVFHSFHCHFSNYVVVSSETKWDFNKNIIFSICSVNPMIIKRRKILWNKNGYCWGPQASLEVQQFIYLLKLIRWEWQREKNHPAIQFWYKGKQSIYLRGRKHMTCSKQLVQLCEPGQVLVCRSQLNTC